MFKFLQTSLFLFVICVYGSAKQTICLNMIVKDESQVICRCLDSVKPFIDYWVIVDTGSTDGTQRIITEYLKGIPGELYERPWRNFGENRTEAVRLAKGKGDYILFMDADDTLVYPPDFHFPWLDKDQYNMWRGSQRFSYEKPQLVRGDLPWKWVGVTHEYLSCDQYCTTEVLSDIRYECGEGGATRKDLKKKFTKDIELLTQGLKEEPKNERYMFYLAESYRCINERGLALETHLKRIAMGGWDQEIFWSKLQVSLQLWELRAPSSVVIASLEDAHQFRPHRVEPIYYLAVFYNQQEQYEKAYRCIKDWLALPKPEQKDCLFNEDWQHDYGLPFELSICAYYVGQYQESLDICNVLLNDSTLPDDVRALAERNRQFPLAKLQSENKERMVSTSIHPK